MPKLKVDECPAGPWLDAAVDRARGFELEFDKYGNAYHKDSVVAGYVLRWVVYYSSQIDAAWKLVEELKMRCGYDPDNGQPFAFVTEDTHTHMSFAETVPLAITRAYLWFKDVSEIDVPEEKTLAKSVDEPE